MNNQLFAPFSVLLKKSFSRTNKTFFRLLAVLLVLTLFLAAYALIIFCVAAFAIYGLTSFLVAHLLIKQIIFGLLAVVGAYAFICWNGAIAYAYAANTMRATDTVSTPNVEDSIFSSAKISWEKGIGFFINSFNAGVLIIFGQTLAVCPCFLLQTNFIFSPYLYVYEQLRNKEARARSRELTKGFGWVVLQRSAIFLLIGYVVLVLALLSVLAPHPLIWLLSTAVVAVYAGAVQSQFIRQIYLESKNADHTLLPDHSQKSWIIPTILIVALILILYYGVKFAFLFLSIRK
jgi:hypothetical protein